MITQEGRITKSFLRVCAAASLPKMNEAIPSIFQEVARCPFLDVEPSEHATVDEQFREFLIAFQVAITDGNFQGGDEARAQLHGQFKNLLIGNYDNIPVSIVTKSQESRPAFAKTKAWILETVAAAWTHESLSCSERAFAFLVDHARSADEKTKVCHLIKVKLEATEFTPAIIDRWRVYMALPPEVDRIFETAKLRKSKNHLDLLAEFMPGERNEAALVLMRRYGAALADMDRKIDQFLEEINDLGLSYDLEMQYCPHEWNPLKGFTLAISIRYVDHLERSGVHRHFDAVRCRAKRLVDREESIVEIILWPRGGSDNLAYGLQDWHYSSK